MTHPVHYEPTNNRSNIFSRTCHTRLIIALGITSLWCNACGIKDVRLKSLDGGEMLVAVADYRAINQTAVNRNSVPGRITPKYITCAEPSPDVAKAVSSALSVSGSGGVTLPSGATPAVAAAVSRARAEALVQLGERLATIQLLRDGLHRACEAYANGAITDTTYAVILSRFDKMMVTMLVSELAAGAFGRSLAAAGAGSEGHASASADLEAKLMRSRDAEETLKEAQESQEKAQQAVNEATTENDKQATKQNLEQSKKNTAKAEKEHKNALKAAADSAAKVSHLTAAGGITATINPEIAKTLHDIQRKYIENLNFDALEVACITTLDRGREEVTVRANAEAYGAAAGKYGNDLSNALRVPEAKVPKVTTDAVKTHASETERQASIMVGAAQNNQMTPFAAYCLSGVLPMIQAKKGELLNAIVVRAEKLKDSAEKRTNDHMDMKKSIYQIGDYLEASKDLINKVKELKSIEIK